MPDVAGGTSPRVADEHAVRAWLHAAWSGTVAEEIESLYRALSGDVIRRSPICRASGRCCRFESWGHRLYVTGLETAYAWCRLDSSCRPGPGEVESARARGGCPFQREVLCGVHAIRPLGCRVYYCDQTAQSWQEDTYERYMRSLRDIHDRSGLPYLYAEWRAMLAVFAEIGADAPTVVSVPGGFPLSIGAGPSAGVRGVGLTIKGEAGGAARPADESRT